MRSLFSFYLVTYSSLAMANWDSMGRGSATGPFFVLMALGVGVLAVLYVYFPEVIDLIKSLAFLGMGLLFVCGVILGTYNLIMSYV